MTKDRENIWILTQTVEETSKTALPTIGRRIASKTFKVTSDMLAERLEEFFENFQGVLERLPNSIAGFSVDEVELTLAINASGAIELIGKAEAGVSTGLKFTLKRQNDKVV